MNRFQVLLPNSAWILHRGYRYDPSGYPCASNPDGQAVLYDGYGCAMHYDNTYYDIDGCAIHYDTQGRGLHSCDSPIILSRVWSRKHRNHQAFPTKGAFNEQKRGRV